MFPGATAIMGVLVTALLPFRLAAAPVDRLQFPPSAWAPKLLARLADGPVYLDRHLDLPIAPPPANSSGATRAELAYLRRVTAARNGHDTRMIREENHDPSLFFLTRLGLEPSDYPRTVALLRATTRDVAYFILREKWRFQRARPIQLAPELSEAIPTPPHAAYPSGHGGQARAVAIILGRLAPEHAPFWTQYARDIGARREMAGVHYPSDTQAGIRLADYLVSQLLAHPDFARLFAAAQAEWPPTDSP